MSRRTDRHPEAGPRVLLCYANKARVASESLGFRIVTRLLSRHGGVRLSTLCLPDDELRGPPSGQRLEADGRSISSFDLVLLSLSFEGDAPHVPRLLGAGGLPPLAGDRRPGHPLVVAGGAMIMINPEPVAAFCDLFLVGEAEGHLEPLLDRWLAIRSDSRDDQIRELVQLPGTLAPSLRSHRIWEVTGEGLSAFEEVSLPAGSGAPDPQLEAADRWVETLHWNGIATEASSGRLPGEAGKGPDLLLELGRGCPRRCRFCAAGRIYAPLRECPAPVLLERATQEVEPGDVVGLMSLSAGDYRQLEPLVEGLLQLGVRLSISSLPATFKREEVVRGLIQSGLRSLTIAPETGTDSLRKRIGKPLVNETILRAVQTLGKAGLRRLRAYFIVGLPGEEEEDIGAIHALLAEMRSRLGPQCRLSATVGAFVPKPRTPFQWAPMASAKLLRERARQLRADRPGGVELKIKSFREARRQALVSRGDVCWGARLDRMARTGQTLADVLRAEDVTAEDLTGPVADGASLPWDYLLSERERKGLWREWKTSRPSQKG